MEESVGDRREGALQVSSSQRTVNELLPEDLFPAALKHLQTYGKGYPRIQSS